jgi:hypothetical protein
MNKCCGMVQRSLIGGDEWAKESENQMFDTKILMYGQQML